MQSKSLEEAPVVWWDFPEHVFVGFLYWQISDKEIFIFNALKYSMKFNVFECVFGSSYLGYPIISEDRNMQNIISPLQFGHDNNKTVPKSPTGRHLKSINSQSYILSILAYQCIQQKQQDLSWFRNVLLQMRSQTMYLYCVSTWGSYTNTHQGLFIRAEHHRCKNTDGEYSKFHVFEPRKKRGENHSTLQSKP